MLKKLFFTSIFFSILTLILSFCTQTEAEKGLGDPAKNYQKFCAGCHGERLEDFVNRKWIYGNSWNEVKKSIAKGYPVDGMSAYEETFSDQELAELTDYIMNAIENQANLAFAETNDWTGIIESEKQNFRLEKVVSGLNSPWGLAFLPNGDLLVTDKSGEFYRHNPEQGLQQISGVPKVKYAGQGGLMDVAVHPEFEENNWIYLSFSKPNGNTATTAILRAKLNGTQLSQQEIIFEAAPYFNTRHHYGSKLVFDKEGYLYFGVGDRGRRDDNPQYLNNHCGKIHRIKDDGSIPADNPFVNDDEAKHSIYSYGHRNPQGIAMHPETGRIWEHEHGPRGGDELNLIQKGQNYGWPVISYGINYNGTIFTNKTEQEGMLQPEKYWVPSIAPCGMSFVDSDLYPNWKNDILVGSLRFKYIARVDLEGDEVVGEEALLEGIGRLRAIEIGPEGHICFSVEEPGVVYRIIPEG